MTPERVVAMLHQQWHQRRQDECHRDCEIGVMVDRAYEAGERFGRVSAAAICEEQAVRLARKDEHGEIWKDGTAMASGATHCAMYIRAGFGGKP